jgi:hypothetical protein
MLRLRSMDRVIVLHVWSRIRFLSGGGVVAWPETLAVSMKSQYNVHVSLIIVPVMISSGNIVHLILK